MISIQCLDYRFTNIQAIVFDKDGTLEDSGAYLRNLAQKRARLIDAQFPGVGEPLLMAFGVNGGTLDPAGLQAVGSRRENEIAAAAYIAETGRGWITAGSIVRTAFEEADKVLYSTPADLFYGCAEQLIAFASAGLKLGIVSAATTEGVTKFAQHHQLTNHFQTLLGSDLRFAKPDPRLFQEACQQMGVDPAHILMVGDSIGDMIMAREGGAAGCIGITWTGSRRPLVSADVTIASLAELKINS